MCVLLESTNRSWGKQKKDRETSTISTLSPQLFAIYCLWNIWMEESKEFGHRLKIRFTSFPWTGTRFSARCVSSWPTTPPATARSGAGCSYTFWQDASPQLKKWDFIFFETYMYIGLTSIISFKGLYLSNYFKNFNENSGLNRSEVVLIIFILCIYIYFQFFSCFLHFLRESSPIFSSRVERLVRRTAIIGTRGYPPSWLEFQVNMPLFNLHPYTCVAEFISWQTCKV